MHLKVHVLLFSQQSFSGNFLFAHLICKLGQWTLKECKDRISCETKFRDGRNFFYMFFYLSPSYSYNSKQHCLFQITDEVNK